MTNIIDIIFTDRSNVKSKLRKLEFDNKEKFDLALNAFDILSKIKKSKLISFSTSGIISQGYIYGKLFNVDTLKVCTVGLFENANDSLYNYASIQTDFNNNFEFKIKIKIINKIKSNIYIKYYF